MSEKPLDIPSVIKNYTEIKSSDNKPGFKLGTKNQRKLERLRMLAKQARGTR